MSPFCWLIVIFVQSKSEFTQLTLVTMRLYQHFIRVLKLVLTDDNMMFLLFLWWILTTAGSYKAICGPRGPWVPPATQGHQNVFSCGGINILCHSAIHTEYNSSYFSDVYVFLLQLFDIWSSIRATWFPSSFTSLWNQYGVELKNSRIKNVTTDSQTFTRHWFIAEQIASIA